jgi:hypothetical protein
MNQVIAYKTPENTVSIVVPTGELSIDEVASKDVPPNTPYKILNRSELPQDRAFRNAWELNDTVEINLEKAKEIHKNNIRAARNPLLAELDIQFQRALESGSDTSEIVAKKIALRDATIDAKISLATTPEELKAAWNEELLGSSPYV